MDISLYNTLSRKKEHFEPVQTGKIGMYNCGPTVYDRAHIGNLRAYIFADTLRRMFEYNDYSVNQIMNITDVGHLSGENAGAADEGEDKMSKALRREGMPLTLDAMYKVATIYFEKFVEDLKCLNIELPTKFPRAADHIKEDIDLIEILLQKGFTYKTSDGIYFDTSKFVGYGKLGNIDIASLKAGARVAENTEKRNPTDFALWKFSAVSAPSKPANSLSQILGWESPWGTGFPGWHIECSAMSTKYLGQPFDIHTGAIDLIPTHHNNEIAQSEAANGKPLANYWMHNGFINVDGKKMSKSAGGFITLETLKKEAVSPIAYRYWLLTSHYRSPANFTYEAVRGAEKALTKLVTILRNYPSNGKIVAEYKDKFTTFINDDLDTPRAVALIWDLSKDSAPDILPADKLATILDFDNVLGLGLNLTLSSKKSAADLSEAIPHEVTAIAEAREKSRQDKDWNKADSLRGQIEVAGFDVLDNKAGGYELRKK